MTACSMPFAANRLPACGDTRQTPLAVAGQRVAANICYEDVFGEEIIRALPEATLLVNFTNDAWYGYSHAAAQHNQISQLRALESGRMMLRATNTGVTSIIGADGRVLQQLPQHVEGVLNGMAQGYAGATPYVRMGNAAVMLLLIAMLGYAWARRLPLPPSAAGEGNIAPPPSRGRGWGEGGVNWFCYLLRCADDTLYCGITNDLDKRLAAHNTGTASKYTRTRTPVELAYSESCADKSAALKREMQIKKLSREKKRALCSAVYPTLKLGAAMVASC